MSLVSDRRIAIMQPYLFPYIGYFQLMHHVDEFWLLDTVQFIKRGWMNRNALWVSGDRQLFSIPMLKAPRDALVNARRFSPEAGFTLRKLEASLNASYAGAEHRNTAAEIIRAVHDLCEEPEGADFVDVVEQALKLCSLHLGVSTPIRRVSELSMDHSLRAQEKIIAACKAIGAASYLNMEAGRALYDPHAFKRERVELLFLEQELLPYNQGRPEFEPGLSVLDALAHVATDDLAELVAAGSISAA